MAILIRLLLFILMAVGVYVLVRRLLAAAAPQPAPRPEAARPVSQLVQDPNCGVYLDVHDAVARKVGNGQVFFCSAGCADAWMAKKQGA